MIVFIEFFVFLVGTSSICKCWWSDEERKDCEACEIAVAHLQHPVDVSDPLMVPPVATGSAPLKVGPVDSCRTTLLRARADGQASSIAN